MTHPPEHQLSIILHEKTSNQEHEWVRTLAHECIHCLNFTQKPGVTYLEEGVAEAFSFHYARGRFPGRSFAESPDVRYGIAKDLVEKLEAIDPGIVRNARLHECSTGRPLSQITQTLLERYGCPPELAKELTRYFYAKLIPVEQIRPAAPPGSGPKRDQLIESMQREGWIGRPLLLVEVEDGEPYRALTGSHRCDAARKAPVPRIPCYIIENTRWRDAELDFERILHLSEPDRVAALLAAGFSDAAYLCQLEIPAT